MREYEDYRQIDDTLAVALSMITDFAHSNRFMVCGTIAFMDRDGKNMSVHKLDTGDPRPEDVGFND